MNFPFRIIKPSPHIMLQACLQRHLRKFGEFIRSEIPAYHRFSMLYYRQVKGGKNKLKITYPTHCGIHKLTTQICYQRFFPQTSEVCHKVQKMPTQFNSPVLLRREAGDKGMESLLVRLANVPICRSICQVIPAAMT